jgi:polyferredoxin
VLIGGWVYPALGFFLLVCMAGGIAIASRRGRAWCDWMCPRGSFYDLFLSKISRNRRIPELFKRRGVRLFMLALLIGVLGSQLYMTWGDPRGMGLSMVRLLTVTTTVGIVLGATYNQRLWCHICPVGTVSNWLSSGKEPVLLDGPCAGCKVCSKVCPMQLKPYEHKTPSLASNDCIKCSTCVAACPKKSLAFDKRLRKAA